MRCESAYSGGLRLALGSVGLGRLANILVGNKAKSRVDGVGGAYTNTHSHNKEPDSMCLCVSVLAPEQSAAVLNRVYTCIWGY